MAVAVAEHPEVEVLEKVVKTHLARQLKQAVLVLMVVRAVTQTLTTQVAVVVELAVLAAQEGLTAVLVA
jgi:hypothetical protein